MGMMAKNGFRIPGNLLIDNPFKKTSWNPSPNAQRAINRVQKSVISGFVLNMDKFLQSPNELLKSVASKVTDITIVK